MNCRCAGWGCSARRDANWAVSGEFAPKENDSDTPPKKLAHGADLLLAFGVRFDDRVTGKVGKFCETGTTLTLTQSVRDQQKQSLGQPARGERH